MSEAENKLQRIKSLLDQLEAELKEVRLILKGEKA